VLGMEGAFVFREGVHPPPAWGRGADVEVEGCEFGDAVAVGAELGVPADELDPGRVVGLS
jgi:hypothetical protein